MFLCFVSCLLVALASAKCYESNPAHPPPIYGLKDAGLLDAFASIDHVLDGIIAAEKYDGASFSVAVTSSKEMLWSRHHTARVRNESRPDIPVVNGDALYRIASITKTFTTLGVLYQHAAGNLSLDDTIDKYVPELQGEQDGSIPWKDITLRTLASQLSGIPREFAQGDVFNLFRRMPYEPWEIGLPPLSNDAKDALPKCDEYGDNYEPKCLKKAKDPVFAPNQKSTYSNVAFELLGLAISKVTGLSYEDYIGEAIFKPLGMSKSTLSRPPDSAGVIPLEPQYWDVDEGVQNPTGGIYSSTEDLSRYLRYILTHYNGITHAANWANPVSPAEGIYSFYGMPWEIFHTDKILRDSRRMVRFVTKSGGLPGYFTIIMFLPEYDLGITILTAGSEPYLLHKLLEAVTVPIVRAAEELAIQQLNQHYVGSFSSEDEGLNSSLRLQADHRGLVMTEFISNSTDLFKSPFWDIVGAPQDRDWYLQGVPTMLYSDEKNKKGEKWRFNIAEYRNSQNTAIWDDFCITNLDTALYANLPLNELVFWADDDGVIEAIELTGFRSKLIRLHRDEKQGSTYQDGEQETLEL
ncbi:beta-lactamase family protein [Lophiotrema nucula]|uniref:Beta-lactamase family protein n=1 Tax=Lophiotrema nucula TaxID=690887 RepID=A0A6A5YE76_9PLEO|nr:beta-lactamase family protein [Lophiotrema nucula]